ncbi:MAG: glycosyltransferase family 2 protein [Candidatus Omnitrophica bacterium]|nr:glycosyltransferase family 2 protein [Candidatus Omnitrophota bacterium]
MAGINKSDVLVLIPAYNEAKNIRRVVSAVMSGGFPVLVVDDASQDRTLAEIAGLPIHTLRLPENKGKGAALRAGFAWFLEKRYQALIMMDADGQHDPAELDVFMDALQKENGAVLLIGNRMHNPLEMPLLRRVTNRFLSGTLSFLARRSVPDSQCGFRALTRAAIQRMRLQTNRFEIESEMVLEAARAGCVIRSVPIRSVYEGAASQINPWRDTLRFLRFLGGYLAQRGLVFFRSQGEK